MSQLSNILTDSAAIHEMLGTVRRVAVLGIRSEQHGDRPAHYVAAALQKMGLEIVPVPVYEPEVRTILGQPVYRSLAEIPDPVDLVDVFRRPADIPAHLDDIIAARPRVVWFQAGIRNDEAARRLADEGIVVVQDRCLMVEYRAYQQYRR